MQKPREIVAALGRNEIAEAVGVGLSAIYEAARQERLPAAWFIACRELARRKGVVLEESAFTFKIAPLSDMGAADAAASPGQRKITVNSHNHPAAPPSAGADAA